MTMQKIGFDSSETSTTQKFGIGDLHFEPNGGGVWEYVQANGAITAGYAALIPDQGDATADNCDAVMLTTTNAGSVGQKVGFADCAFADNAYGWLWRGCGDFEAVVTNGVSAETILTTTGTNGLVGTGGVALDGLRNIDAGVTGTRVTVHCPGLLTVGVAAASD